MNFFLPTRLQTLFWEIKNRSLYVFVSFVLCFALSYQNSTSLLYLFVLSYKKINNNDCGLLADVQILQKQDSFYDNKNDLSVENVFHQAFLYDEDINETSLSSLLYFYKIIKNIDISFISFIFTDVEEAFSSTILICFIFSLVTIIPICLYQSFSFFLPSLYLFEKQKWLAQIFGVTSLWYLYIYNVQNNLIPKLADFLLTFQISSSSFSILGFPKIYSYCTWAITFFIGTSLIFLGFCLLFFCLVNQKIQIEYFTKRRKMSRAVILVLSALIAPPEIQLILALVVLLSFELAIYFFFFYKNFLQKSSY